jgi:hypothetical protein
VAVLCTGLPTPHPDNIKLIMIAKAKVVIFVIGSLLSANNYYHENILNNAIDIEKCF